MISIIPARGGSKRVFRKNIRLFYGKPLLSWTIDQSIRIVGKSRTFISTEDNEIEEIALALGANVIKRPIRLANDDSPTIDCLVHAYNVLKENGNEHFSEDLLLLQCTSPLRCDDDIRASIQLFNDNEMCDSVISVAKLKMQVDKIRFLNNEDGFLRGVTSLRDFNYENSVIHNGAIYVLKRKLIVEKMKIESDLCLPYIMNEVDSIDIDTELDFKISEMIFKDRYISSAG